MTLNLTRSKSLVLQLLHIVGVFHIQEMYAKSFYQLLYLITLRTCLLSALNLMCWYVDNRCACFMSEKWCYRKLVIVGSCCFALVKLVLLDMKFSLTVNFLFKVDSLLGMSAFEKHLIWVFLLLVRLHNQSSSSDEVVVFFRSSKPPFGFQTSHFNHVVCSRF